MSFTDVPSHSTVELTRRTKTSTRDTTYFSSTLSGTTHTLRELQRQWIAPQRGNDRTISVARKSSYRCGVAVTEFLAPGRFDRTNSCRQEIVLSLRRCGDGIPGTWTLLIGQILIAKKSSYRWGAAVTEFLALGRFDRTNSCRQEIVLSLGRCADGILGARTL